jgi:CheY-like chemotaxis protein
MSERVALVVDDVSANREFLERLLYGAKFKVLSSGTATQALKLVEDLPELPLALVDMKLPDMTGVQLATALRARFPKTYLVIATMLDERSLMEQAFAAGCNAFLVKPHGFMELFKRLTTTPEIEVMQSWPQVIIDQYGPRVFKTTTQSVPKVPKDTP